jgi:polar amino acid transport system substrate-binding protein
MIATRWATWTVALMTSLLMFGNCRADNLIIGVENTKYYPHYDSDGDTYFGFARELLDLFAKQYHHQISYRVFPVERLYSSFLQGDVDFKYPDNPAWRKDLKQNTPIIYSTAVASYTDGLMVKPENLPIHDPSQLKIISTMLGFTAFEYLPYQQRGLEITYNPSIIGALEQSLIDRVEGTYLNIDVARYHLTHTLKNPNGLVFNRNLPFTHSSYFLSTIKRADIIKQFNRFISENQTQIIQMKAKYGIFEDQ